MYLITLTTAHIHTYVSRRARASERTHTWNINVRAFLGHFNGKWIFGQCIFKMPMMNTKSIHERIIIWISYVSSGVIISVLGVVFHSTHCVFVFFVHLHIRINDLIYWLCECSMYQLMYFMCSRAHIFDSLVQCLPSVCHRLDIGILKNFIMIYGRLVLNKVRYVLTMGLCLCLSCEYKIM